MLVSENVKPPTLGLLALAMYIPCTFHVHFMYFFRVGNAKISRRKGRFQWNTGLKPIFHRKRCLRWLPNANEIDTNNMKLHGQRKPQRQGTQRNLYSTYLRWSWRWVDGVWRLVRKAFQIPTCWYSQRKIVALGV